MHHAFLDLVPADGRTAHRLGDLVSQGGLARSRGAADHHERGRVCHVAVIANHDPARARYVPDGIDNKGNRRSMRDNCLVLLTSQALIRAVAETAF